MRVAFYCKRQSRLPGLGIPDLNLAARSGAKEHSEDHLRAIRRPRQSREIRQCTVTGRKKAGQGSLPRRGRRSYACRRSCRALGIAFDDVPRLAVHNGNFVVGGNGKQIARWRPGWASIDIFTCASKVDRDLMLARGGVPDLRLTPNGSHTLTISRPGQGAHRSILLWAAVDNLTRRWALLVCARLPRGLLASKLENGGQAANQRDRDQHRSDQGKNAA